MGLTLSAHIQGSKGKDHLNALLWLPVWPLGPRKQFLHRTDVGLSEIGAVADSDPPAASPIGPALEKDNASQ